MAGPAIIAGSPPTYDAERSVPIVSDDRIERGDNPGFRVLDEHRVWDLRKLQVSGIRRRLAGRVNPKSEDGPC